MPVTLTTAAHPPRAWEGPRVSTSEDLFAGSCPGDQRQAARLIQSSFPQKLFRDSNISASQHGFVWAVICAYSNHHNLIIRPEDVWFSILTQLSFYVNAHAEKLRSFFVSHEGQKELEVVTAGSIDDADFGGLALEMTRLIQENVVDDNLRAWIMPNFSTTTESDNVVAAILMMGNLQKYFSYTMTLACGIPFVTLLGEKENWNQLVKKLDKLQQLGDEPARFAQLLRPILNNFVASCAHKDSMGSGTEYLGGWVSVFCFWDANGKLLCRERIYPTSSRQLQDRNSTLGIEEALSRRIDMDDVPSGFASVPVTINDNGMIYETTMVAGLVGIQATSTGAISDGTSDHQANTNRQREPAVQSRSIPTRDVGFSSIQPLSGWWMYEIHPQQGK